MSVIGKDGKTVVSNGVVGFSIEKIHLDKKTSRNTPLDVMKSLNEGSDWKLYEQLIGTIGCVPGCFK